MIWLRRPWCIIIITGRYLEMSGTVKADIEILNDEYLLALNKAVDKYKNNYFLLAQWMRLRNRGTSLSQFFLKHDYMNIAIYGMAELGILLVDEINGNGFNSIYGIDRNYKNIDSDILVYNPDDELPKSDVLVVTVLNEFILISKQMKKVGIKNIISLEDVVYGLH